MELAHRLTMNNWFTHYAIAPFALPNLAAVCRFAPNYTATKLQLFMNVGRNVAALHCNQWAAVFASRPLRR